MIVQTYMKIFGFTNQYNFTLTDSIEFNKKHRVKGVFHGVTQCLKTKLRVYSVNNYSVKLCV